MILAGRLRPNSYVDSVALRRAAESLRRLRGVDEVALVMGTEANRAALAEGGLWPPNLPDATADDLVMVVRADGSETAEIALSRVEELLQPRERMGAVPLHDEVALKRRARARGLFVMGPEALVGAGEREGTGP